MKVYVGQTRSHWLVAELTALGYGECTCRGELPPRRRPWFYDNGAYKDFRAGVDFDVAAFESDVATLRIHPLVRPDFVVAPDIVAGGVASLDRSRAWLPRLTDLAPVYLAVQDGMEAVPAEDLAAGFAGIFVGGSTEWKFRTGGYWVKHAHRLGLPCHIGRAGSGRKVRWAQRIGADSIDSSLPLFSKGNLRTFRNAVEREQGDFFGSDAMAA